MNFSKEDLVNHVTFKSSRSGGKGGQNVNKVNSKIELNFDLESSALFTDEQKLRIRKKLENRMTSEGRIQVISQEERSQLFNKDTALDKLFMLLQNALKVDKKRKATKPRKSAVEQRLKEKQMQAVKKLNRKKEW